MNSALDEALLLKQNPDRLFFQQQLPLPNGIAQLIRIAIDPGSVSISQAQRQDFNDEQIKAAAAAYLKGVCLFPGSQGLRVLGLNDASDNKIMLEHRRLLLKWLHPDRNPENRHLAERVNRAWALQKAGQIESVIAQNPSDFVPPEVIAAPKARSTRFPVFLAGIAALVGVLWLFSRMPDTTEYLGGSLSGNEKPQKPKIETALPDLTTRQWGESATQTLAPAESTAIADAPSEPAPIAVAPPTIQTAAPVKSDVISLPDQTAVKPVVASIPKPASKATPEQKTQARASTPLPAKPVPKGVVKAVPEPTNIKTPGPIVMPPQAKAAVAVAPPAASNPLATEITAATSQDALKRFLQMYRAGNLDVFMTQFSADAKNNRGGRDAIKEDYARLFLQSKRRDLEFSQAQWQPMPGGIRFKANYRSKVLYEGDLVAERNSGRIEMVFRMDSGQLRIASILVYT